MKSAHYLIFNIELHIDGSLELKRVSSTKFLGILFNATLS